MQDINRTYTEIYSSFEMNFPSFAERATSWWPSGRSEITVKLDDGYKMAYDIFDGCIRRVPQVTDPEMISEEEWRKHFANRLRELMWREGFDSKTMADELGISVQMMSRYSNARSTPSITLIYKMCRLLKCSVRELTEIPDVD